MYTLDELRNLFQQELDKAIFLQEPKNLYAPIDYTMQQGGKRIRPVLMLAACDLFRGEPLAALPAALGLETFHNFTLVHDDILDQSPVRRGKPTVYRKWDANTAILSGDVMFALAYQHFLRMDHYAAADIMRTFNKTAIEVCQGQQLDMDFEKMDDLAVSDYMEMIRLKTAVLLAASLKIGAMVAHASEGNAEAIYRFGINTGLAFQLMDDYLDTFGDEKTFGKRPGNDIMTNKKTFLYLSALQLANKEQKQKLEHYYASNDFEREEKVPAVTKLFLELGIDRLTKNEMLQYHKQALKDLDGIAQPNERKAILRAFANKLIERNF